jgi:hypothetical protein
MDVHQFPGAVPESGGNGGPAVPVVTGSGIVRRYGQGDTAVDARCVACRSISLRGG